MDGESYTSEGAGVLHIAHCRGQWVPNLKLLLKTTWNCFGHHPFVVKHNSFNFVVCVSRCPSKARMKWMPPTTPKKPVATLGPAMASGKPKLNLTKKNQCQMKNVISCPATIKTGLSTKPRKHGQHCGARGHIWNSKYQQSDFAGHDQIHDR
jgi:hypothetical protein